MDVVAVVSLAVAAHAHEDPQTEPDREQVRPTVRHKRNWEASDR